MSEKEIVRRVLNGETRFFGKLVSKYGHSVYGRLYRVLGEPEAARDKCQDVWVDAWVKLPEFDTRRSFEAWVMGFAKCAGLEQRRYLGRECRPLSLDAFQTGDSEDEPVADCSCEPEHRYRKKLTHELLHKALDRVPKPWRDALVYRFEDEMSYAEIAERTGRSIGTVGSDISRGLACLRREFLRLCPAGLLKERSV
jgi:RNA polymerase sigma-70 factor (ECF subfamily)